MVRPTALVLSSRRPVVVLGVAPADKAEGAWSPASASGQRLADLADVSPESLTRVFALDNILPYPSPSRRALKEAGELYRFVPDFWYALAGTEVVRALGRRALPSKATRLPWHRSGPAPFEWYESSEGVVMVMLPHPSGRNRWFNDARCRAAAKKFFTEAAWARRGKAHELWKSAHALGGAR